MGVIFSKLCFGCCGGSSNNLDRPISKSKSKLIYNPSLIIQRSQIFRDVDEVSEYTRVLEKDFEISRKHNVEGKAKGSGLNTSNESREIDLEAGNQFLDIEFDDSDYPKKIFQVKHKETGQVFTLTRIKKSSLNSRSAKNLIREINLLANHLPNHPFLINLYWTWQDSKYLYRVDDEFGSEDDFDHFNNSMFKGKTCKTWDELVRRAGQLATIVHYIHSYGNIHGNINSSSVFLHNDSLKLGSFKYLRRVEGGRRLSGLCGDLSEFRAPECENCEYFEEIDWFSYGKVLEFWYNESKEALNKSSVDKVVDLKDFINKLTNESISEDNRLGYGPAAFKSIQSHKFFGSLNWAPLLNLSTRPEFKSSFGSLSESIGSLKGRSDSFDDNNSDWREFLEFNWDEKGEIGQTLESLIKR